MRTSRQHVPTTADRAPASRTGNPPTFTFVASVELSEPTACTIHVSAIASEFARRGHRTLLLVPRPVGGVAAVDLTAHGVEVRFTPSPRRLGLPNTAGFVLLLPGLVRAVRSGRADVLYTRCGVLSFLVAALGRLLGRSVLVSEHNGWLDGELRTLGTPALLARAGRLAQLMDARLADRVLVVSPPIGTALQRAGVPESKLFVAENGTDTVRLHPMDRAAALSLRRLRPDRRYIGFLGTLTAWQGVEQAIEALALLQRREPAAHLLIGGDGPERAALTSLAQRLGVADRVTFTGYIPVAEANVLLNCFDVAVAPKTASIAALGMSPLKLRDYAAAGRPVVAPDLAGVRELADGWIALYPPDRPSELADALAALLSDPDRRAAMGVAARAYAVERFSWSGTAQVIANHLPPA